MSEQEQRQQRRRELVEKIHNSSTRLVVSVAGGSMALAELQTAPGASRTLLEGLAPYSRGAIRSLVGEEPLPHVSEEGACAIAKACLDRALAYATEYEEDFPVIGVACTSALATQRQRRGADRGWLAVASVGGSEAAAHPQFVTKLVEFEPAAPTGDSEAAAAAHAEAFYERRLAQEHELTDALLEFIAEHVV